MGPEVGPITDVVLTTTPMILPHTSPRSIPFWFKEQSDDYTD